MAYGAAKDADFWLDGHGGFLTDITAYLTSVDIAFSGNTIDVTTFGDAWQDDIRGQAGATLSIEGIYDQYMGTFLPPLATATSSASFEYYPQGSASGKAKLNGECFLTSFSFPGSQDEAVTFGAEFKVTGAITSGTI
ncbi:MAG: phage tail protein [Gemmatimonadaceae bacterium]|nr:phage tail protein [Gemmatimonadaceae bacterium]